MRLFVRPPFFSLAPDATFDREEHKDAVSVALAAAGATKVNLSEWWMMRENGSAVTPLVGRDFVVYQLKRRNVRRRPKVTNQWGVRLGPHANGSLSQKFHSPRYIPPGARQVSPRELMLFLQSPDQVGCPGAVNTDALLSFGVMAY